MAALFDYRWDRAQPRDIARARTLADVWKDRNPAGLSASKWIHYEVETRYRIDTGAVGADAAYLESGIETVSAGQARRDAVAEHRKDMTFIAAAQVGEFRTQIHALAPEIARHEVPVEYRNNPPMVQTL